MQNYEGLKMNHLKYIAIFGLIFFSIIATNSDNTFDYLSTQQPKADVELLRATRFERIRQSDVIIIDVTSVNGQQ